MSDKQIIFYKICDDFLTVAVKLSEKIYESEEKALLLLDSADQVRETDIKLWTYSKLSFIPHGSRFSVPLDKADMCAIWISAEIEFLNHPTVLILNGNINITPSMINFNKIINILSSEEILLLNRAEQYKKMGFIDQKLWIQDGKSWRHGEIQ